ncbi:hypothetical protein TNCV_3113441 [Trichonephila clavipes]|nr:hypothetical protein TNCV_3113441 [Trichonephila clavipes]
MLLNVNPEISSSGFDWQAFDPISVSNFRRSVLIVGASEVISKFNGDSDINVVEKSKKPINLILYCQIQSDRETSSYPNFKPG